MNMFIKSYSPEQVEVYFYRNNRDRASGFAKGEFYEIGDDHITIRLHCASEYIKGLDRNIGKQIPIIIKIPVVCEGYTAVFEYSVDGVVSRKIIGGIEPPIFEYKFSGKVVKA